MQAVGHHAPGGGAAPRSHGDTRALGIAYKVGNDEEIVGKAHFLDHIQLIGQLLAIVLLFLPVAFGKALVAELAQVGRRIIAGRELEFRQVVLAEGKFHLATVSNALGVFHRLGIG